MRTVADALLALELPSVFVRAKLAATFASSTRPPHTYAHTQCHGHCGPVAVLPTRQSCSERAGLFSPEGRVGVTLTIRATARIRVRIVALCGVTIFTCGVTMFT